MYLNVFRDILFGVLQPFNPNLGDDNYYRDLLKTTFSYDPIAGICNEEIKSKIQYLYDTNPMFIKRGNQFSTFWLNIDGTARPLDDSILLNVNDKIPTHYNNRTKYYYYLIASQDPEILYDLDQTLAMDGNKHFDSIIVNLVSQINYLIGESTSKRFHLIKNGLSKSVTDFLNEEDKESLYDDCIYIYHCVTACLKEINAKIIKAYKISPTEQFKKHEELPKKQNTYFPSSNYMSYSSNYFDKNPSLFTSMYKKLKHEGFIHNDTKVSSFKKLFSGNPIIDKVNWVKDKNKLTYLISHLMSKGIIEDSKQNHWKITSLCFLLNGKQIDFRKLRGQEVPAESTKKVIDELIPKP